MLNLRSSLYSFKMFLYRPTSKQSRALSQHYPHYCINPALLIQLIHLLKLILNAQLLIEYFRFFCWNFERIRVPPPQRLQIINIFSRKLVLCIVKTFSFLSILFLIRRHAAGATVLLVWFRVQAAVTLLSTMGLSVYSHNSSLLVELKSLKNPAWTDGQQPRSAASAGRWQAFFSFMNNDVNRTWGEVKGL